MSNDTNERLEQIVNDAMATKLRGDKQVNQTQFESIEAYTQATGKRFRMTKEQKARNITREQAFTEFNQGK